MKANTGDLWNRAWHQLLGLATALAIVLANVATAAAQEGVKVHGHWTIVVRNADGTVASRHEFENALSAGGDRQLVGLLSRQSSTGLWGVLLNGGVCEEQGTSSPSDCFIAEPGLGAVPVPHVSNTLSISAPPAGPDVGKFVLSGSVRATHAGTISVVATGLSQCPPTTAPATPCGIQSFGFLTIRTLSAGIAVVVGQAVDVTVKISFS